MATFINRGPKAINIPTAKLTRTAILCLITFTSLIQLKSGKYKLINKPKPDTKKA